MSERITVTAITTATPAQAWARFTEPDWVMRWNFASEDWTCPAATNELQPGGRFCYRMAAKDGSMAFDYEGTWAAVEPHRRLVQALGDGREVEVCFEAVDGGTRVVESFEPEEIHSRELQQAGWQMILDRFAAVAGS